jgi:glucose-6-phosphate-specific signal transduction histidine kinase
MSVQDSGETSTRKVSENSFSRVPRTIVLIAMILGASGSMGLMLYAARGQQSLLLIALFTGWVLAPFVALIWAYLISSNWATLMRRTLDGVIILVTSGSLAIYGSLALGTLKAKNGFIFLVVPAGAWLLIAIIPVLLHRNLAQPPSVK